MADEKHICNLCSKAFLTGRALGGHMRTHQISAAVAASSSSSSFSGEDQREGEKGVGYGLRENPKRSFRVADPEFHSAIEAEFLVQDRESETESIPVTRKRSCRNQSSGGTETDNLKMKSRKPGFEKLSPGESKSEPISSVLDTSPEEEIAVSLLMLSRDKWETKKREEGQRQSTKPKHLDPSDDSNFVRTKNLCKKCRRSFRSYRALRVHSEICFPSFEEIKKVGTERIYECPFCDRAFGSGQALGGHKRSHLMTPAPVKTPPVQKSLIDLNLPATIEEEEEEDYSVVSDAQLV